MIVSEDGATKVVFDIECSGGSNRRKQVKMTLDAYLVLVKTTHTLEELRVAIFEYGMKGRKSRAAGAE